MISIFPKLVHLDDRIITDDQRIEAARLYKNALLDKMFSKSNVPEYFRTISGKMSNMLSYIPAIGNHKKNIVI